MTAFAPTHRSFARPASLEAARFPFGLAAAAVGVVIVLGAVTGLSVHQAASDTIARTTGHTAAQQHTLSSTLATTAKEQAAARHLQDDARQLQQELSQTNGFLQ